MSPLFISTRQQREFLKIFLLGHNLSPLNSLKISSYNKSVKVNNDRIFCLLSNINISKLCFVWISYIESLTCVLAWSDQGMLNFSAKLKKTFMLLEIFYANINKVNTTNMQLLLCKSVNKECKYSIKKRQIRYLVNRFIWNDN